MTSVTLQVMVALVEFKNKGERHDKGL